MSNLEDNCLAGSFAVLCGLTSKPELNGTAVFVGVFNQETKRFAVTSFSNQAAVKAFTIAVKLDNIDILPPDDFPSLFPGAKVVVGSFDNSVECGTIVEFEECPDFNPKKPSWLLKQPCNVRGTIESMNELGHPVLMFTRTVVISVEDNLEAPVLFENINFDVPSKEGAMHCARSRNITFKNCRFKSLVHGMSIGDRNRLGDNAGKARVRFEDCVFEGCCGTGLVVAGDGHASLLRCVLRHNNKGIEVRDGGTAVLVDCTIDSCAQIGVHLHSKGRCVDMVNCTVSNNIESGVTAADSGTVRLSNCKLSECGCGIDVHGGITNTTVSCDRSTISHCQSGVLAHPVKVKIALNDTKIASNSLWGVSVREGTTGELKISKCSFVDNAGGSIENSTVDDKFSLIADGTETKEKE